MAVTVKKAILWRKHVDNEPGVLSSTLKPLAEAGVNLQILMGYAIPGQDDSSVIELYPISGAKAEAAARSVGLRQSDTPGCLQVTGDDQVGVGRNVAQALGEAGINISFVMIQVVGKKYQGIYGFESQADADKAVAIIKKASTVKKTAKRAGAKKSAAKKSTAKKSTAKKGGTKKAAKKTTKAKSSKVTKLSSRKKPAARKAAQKKASTKRTSSKKSGGKAKTKKK